LLAFEANHTWVSENLEVLLEQYGAQWIAVKKGQVLATDPDLAGLLSNLPDPAHTCVLCAHCGQEKRRVKIEVS